MTQLQRDKNLLKRIDDYGKGLTTKEVALIESFIKWVESGKELTGPQRQVAVDIDERRVS